MMNLGGECGFLLTSALERKGRNEADIPSIG
jgi:hypothetical protein